MFHRRNPPLSPRQGISRRRRSLPSDRRGKAVSKDAVEDLPGIVLHGKKEGGELGAPRFVRLLDSSERLHGELTPDCSDECHGARAK